MPSPRLLQDLPEELLQEVIDRLDRTALTSLNVVSRWCYAVATPSIWREVNLVDCKTSHGEEGDDDHDDLPLIRKLLILAKKPWVASCVQSVTHMCHLPSPAIFNELPRTTFSGMTMSSDPRTTALVKLAVTNMDKVHTLRIIFGHPHLNDALLRCFFDKSRQRSNPVRRLWLENCRISAGCGMIIPKHPFELPLELEFSGVESVRLRRLPLQPGSVAGPPRIGPFAFVHSRSGQVSELQDGAGGMYVTRTNDAIAELNWSVDHWHEPEEMARSNGLSPSDGMSSIEKLFDPANRWDDQIYENVSNEMALPDEVVHSHIESHWTRSFHADRGFWLDPQKGQSTSSHIQREQQSSLEVMIDMAKSFSATLTNLCLDWVLTKQYEVNLSDEVAIERWMVTFLELFSLRFPNLRSFQLRNAVVGDTRLPEGLYLFDVATVPGKTQSWATGVSISTQTNLARSEFIEAHQTTSSNSTQRSLACLEFMEAHQNLQCLAWPMERFFSNRHLPQDVASRVQAVVDNLGRTLVDLRVDHLYSGIGEHQSENFFCPNQNSRDRRRRFISDFASKMTRLESIKVEGGIPRDERREVVRALHACPLKKIVMIGVCSPLGNTWGAEGRDLAESLGNEDLDMLEGEHKDATYALGSREPEAPPSNFSFVPTFGWPPSPPMIHTIASFHAETVTELKFCGYKGAPILFTPTPITLPLLMGLKQFHNLETLIMSLWLCTEFEGSHRDSDIINYWLDARNPASTSLVRITDEEPEGWEKELRTKYAPDALAWQVTSLLGPFLSERAKSRREGVHVRASVCIGDWGGIFDIDLHVGKGSLNSDICLGYKGPREETQPDRRKSKLEQRRWF